MLARHRWIVFVVVLVVVVVGALSVQAGRTVRGSFPQTVGEISVPVLSNPVQVVRDAHGVAHLYADDAEDLFAAEGFVHAQDRFFEMDVRRHITAGRLSELFGPSQVQTDIYLRTLGLRRVAEAELPLQRASTRRYLDAYAAGVNAYISTRTAGQLSLEYAVLGFSGLDSYTPEPWTAVDSLAWLKAMAWSLDGNLSNEVERSVMTSEVGAEQASQLFPGYDLERHPPIVGQGRVVDDTFDPKATNGSNRPAPAVPSAGAGSDAEIQQALLAAAGAVRTTGRVLGDPTVGGLGSNSWVVSGGLSTTGSPILGNDPHLATSIPGPFEQIGLHCTEVTRTCPFDVTGFSFSGLPGVVIGHNADIAWGLTTSYVDVQDAFVEQLRGDTVRVGSTWRPLESREEQIRVNGEATRIITVRSTRHGPLLSDADPALAEQLRPNREAPQGSSQSEYAVALAWSALTPGRSMDALLAMATASDFTQARAALSRLSSPSQNVVYADTAGNIGYQLPGLIPERGEGDGLTPNPGWDPAYDWQGWVPFTRLPYSYNPPSGYIVAANQPVIGPQYRPTLTAGSSYGWRSGRIAELIERSGSVSPSSADPLFTDSRLTFAADLAPALLKVKVDDPWIAEGQQTLVGWDYDTATDSAAAAYFNIVFYDILKRTFRDQMPESLWPTDLDRYYAVVAELVKQPNNPWWDDVSTPKVERRDDILKSAMTDARKEATSLMSRDTAGWQWGTVHRVQLVNQTLGTSGVGAVERLFNRRGGPVSGGSAVVDAMGYRPDGSYAVTVGPAMRMLVDLSDLDGSRWVNQSGNSGHAFHRNYDDQLPLWVDGQWLPMVSSVERVDLAATDRLTLTPGG